MNLKLVFVIPSIFKIIFDFDAINGYERVFNTLIKIKLVTHSLEKIWKVKVLTYLLLLTLTYSLTHSLTHLLTYSLTYLLTYSLTYLLTHSLTHSLTYLLTYLLTRTHSLTHLLHSRAG